MCGNSRGARAPVLRVAMVVLLAGVTGLPAQADSIDDFQKARREKIMRELEAKSGPDPRAVLQNVQPTVQEVIPVYKGSYGSATNARDRYVLLAYERKTLEARLNDVLPGGWQVIEIGLSYAKIQKGGVTRFLDVKLPTSTFPRGLNPSIFQPIN